MQMETHSSTNEQYLPVTDLNKCEGKGVCAHVCLMNVLKVKPISPEQYASLPFCGKLKTVFNGGRKVQVVNPAKCIGCGLCVSACSQQAIQLIKV